MLFSKVCLCLMLLYAFFVTCKSTYEVICFVDEYYIGYNLKWLNPLGMGSPGFWEKFPCKATCTRHVLLNTNFGGAEENINEFKSIMTTMHQEKNEMAFWVEDGESGRGRWRFNLPLIKRHFNGVYIFWMPKITDDLAKRLQFMEEVINDMRRLKKTVSQGVFCQPGQPEVIRVGQLSLNADITVVQLYLPDLEKFRPAIIYMCVLPVEEHGIPRDKIFVGLVLTRFRKVCKEDKRKASDLRNFALEMTNFATKQYGLAGVIVYSLDGDDYTGQECGWGKYPFLRAHTGDLLDSCTPLEAFMSAAIVVKPTIVTSLIYLVVMTILFEGFY